MGFPKIQVDSREDILFLKDELAKAARGFLSTNQAFLAFQEECTDQEKDGGSQRLGRAQQVVDVLTVQWVDRLFQMAGYGIQVNGLEFEEAMLPDLEMEPYDEALHLETQNLQARVEDLTLKKAPPQIGQPNADTSPLKSTEETRTESYLPDRCHTEYSKAVDNIVEIKKALPATLAKLDRIQTALHDEQEIRTNDLVPNYTGTATKSEAGTIGTDDQSQQQALLERLTRPLGAPTSI
ncbi:hypothetical protein BJ085DRAFT_39902 [Dimargaris cristalligena]|uniref:Uncharacterized protein n=1 Tax=Dimargaris cristalligena TaxID=215637 RepID=A0A4P9ZNN4_9FUNG|nr:hypothetical protein BJ085DRAFT_39902 [Dimargaris cristalligena]|eukprot:RKP34221.1 hypothetical protein BJ085DRAFT_39902 [Dimargaris cristalligena]